MGSETAEIVICGGGLAGSAAAIRLHQLGFTPLVVEKQHFPRKKLCGEFLSPDSFSSFQTLACWETVSKHAYGPIEKAVFHPMNRKPFMVEMAWLNERHPYGLSITRETLDWLMMERVKSLGIPVMEQCRVLPGVRQTDYGFNLRVEHFTAAQAGRVQRIKARYVIDATGRSSTLACPGHINRKKGHYVAAKLHIRLKKPVADRTLHMFFFPQGYGGLQPLSLDVQNLCFLGPVSMAKSFRQPFDAFIAETIGKNPDATAYLNNAMPITPMLTTADICHRLLMPQHNNLLRVGDALGMMDPLTGSGMSVALQTGILAAETLADGLHRGAGPAPITQAYYQQCEHHLGRRMRWLHYLRPLMFSTRLQHAGFPVFKPFLPQLARVLR